MKRFAATVSLLAATVALAGCGGGGGGSTAPASSGVPVVSAPAPAPAPAPTPTPTPTPTPAPASPVAAGPVNTVLPDSTFWSKGSYYAYASPWCAMNNKALVVGRDLINTISFNGDAFPGAVRIDAQAPGSMPWAFGCGVYGYHHLGYGNYDGSHVKQPIAPRRVRDIATLGIALDVAPGAGDYNLLNEFYLTSAAGDNAAKIIEIGYFLHASADAVRFSRTGTTIGVHVDAAGRRWDVRRVNNFVMAFPADGSDVVSGSLDVKGLLSFLRDKGVVTGDEWFNGIAVGIEPVTGSSSVTIHRWTVAYG